MMSAMWSSIVPVLSALAGITLTFLLQWHTERRREQVAHGVRTWEARRAAYLELIDTLVEYRRRNYDRERARFRSPDGTRPDEAHGLREARAATRVKNYQARLVAPTHSRVPEAWQQAADEIRSFYIADDQHDLEARSENAKQAIEALVQAARADLDGRGDTSMIATPYE